MAAPLDPTLTEIISTVGGLGQGGMAIALGFFVYWFNKRQNQEREDKQAISKRLQEIEDRQFNGLSQLVADSKTAVETTRGALERNTMALDRIASAVRWCERRSDKDDVQQ